MIYDANSLRETFGIGPACAVVVGGRLEIEEKVRIDVRERLVFKGDAIIRDHCRISGRYMELGDKFYMDHHAEIGGGSCFSRHSYFKCGRNVHIGKGALVNTARGVKIGHEVAIGLNSAIHTHGAWLDVTHGFPERWGPVKIGNNVWMPTVTVLPGVTIGDNTVVAAVSLVDKDILGGGLWAGIPARQKSGIVYPNPMSVEERRRYIESIRADFEVSEEDELRRHGLRDYKRGDNE